MEFVQALISGLIQCFNWSTLSLMLIGIAIGFVVGILPGLGGPTAMALMLPFIFKMSAVEAFAFLLGMTAVTATTGDITSVLFGVPGEPTTASTIVDGHTMAKNGEAGRALGAVLMSSLVGAIFAAVALAVAVPVIRPLVLSFGSPEFFMLALLGITFVASLSGEDVLKGIIAGGIGLMLATIGLDPISGIQRYTFGQLFLWDGIGLVPITIGFYAIPETIELAVLGTSIAKQEVGKLGGVMEGVRDTFRHWWLVIRCSALGTFTAIIPGMGAATTQWLAYAHAVQSSPNKERFGKGAVEGVLGPGAANNSTLGGSLITTIAFGVPASVVMAILLGAFIIQGIVPGPDMLLPPPKGKLDLTFSFVWVIILSNIVTVAVCFVFLNPLAKVTQVRGGIIIPVILVLIYLGAFAEKNAFPDMIVVLFFGALGWIMEKLEWPRPPVLLGLVLGPLAENRLFLSTDNYGLAWTTRPGVIAIFLLTLAGIFFPILKGRSEERAKRSERPEGGATIRTATPHRFHFGAPALFSLVVVVTLAAALWQSRNFGLRAGLFPWVVGTPTLLLALGQLVKDMFARDKKPAAAAVEVPPEIARRRTLNILGWTLAFFLAIWFLGFSYAVPLMMLLYLKFPGREGWPITLAVTACTWLFFWGLFERALNVPFPEGLVFQLFGAG
ncbi:MAG TPA: tripartite tricarboxylate transporter permease [candidate division Zixibacteria bacterium]|nr:tripartite tricarboxylate transporter permease [candidate division Zixibacteria bacterium]